ncbi:hypothetical protein NXS19_002743 [Fusarium pseudograminearum]|uniref:Uncharacterized protein n=1 Tax=Fusarium pseudograminearum (strain CS3096) TaxID=1028729 RepID=K3VU45_FUSPC|nr:hypothetical protein FPSE_00618 [Fusarium pseudograminearum CS3096]EKJ79307.1 hypothetical protein FPSE_00618 [Fusarium pseudograminearum CS3096]KAF0645787.1 hypothetical protein FPSE5266_00618 [Fusarium pseudograminearum]UZP34927.1 hypothetical protein NXS19_002743 [Fusarium pseudograminearum]
MSTVMAQHETQGQVLQHAKQGLEGSMKPVNPEIDADEMQEQEQEEGRMRPSLNFTGHQLFYVFGLDGVGAMLLSGGVNFALAYPMYTTQDTTKNPIRLFQLPNTLAGDAAVTIIIQCILTWFVEMGLVSYDLSKRSVQPVGFIPEPSHPWMRWLLFLPPSDPSDSETESEKVRPVNESKADSLFNTIVQGALRGFVFAVAGFILLWPLSVGILTTLGERDGGDWRYDDHWIPQAFKAILGGILSLLTTPLMALFWLVKAGWEGNDERSNARESRRSQYADAQRQDEPAV